MSKTVFDNAHQVAELRNHVDLLHVDRHLMHVLTGAAVRGKR